MDLLTNNRFSNSRWHSLSSHKHTPRVWAHKTRPARTMALNKTSIHRTKIPGCSLIRPQSIKRSKGSLPKDSNQRISLRCKHSKCSLNASSKCSHRFSNKCNRRCSSRIPCSSPITNTLSNSQRKYLPSRASTRAIQGTLSRKGIALHSAQTAPWFNGSSLGLRRMRATRF